VKSIGSKVAFRIAYIKHAIGFFKVESSDGGAEKPKAAIIFLLFEEDDLHIPIIKAANDDDLVVYHNNGYKGREFFIVEADCARLNLI
jgi:hypothetical protein